MGTVHRPIGAEAVVEHVQFGIVPLTGEAQTELLRSGGQSAPFSELVSLVTSPKAV